MNATVTVSKLFKLGAIAAVVAASAIAYAGTTIKITNNSKQPWTLRVTEEQSGPVIMHTSADQTPVELSAQNNKLVFPIQPGETCVIQFKEMKEPRQKKDIGLVDKTGTELGQLRLETQTAPTLQRLGGCEEDPFTTTLAPSEEVKAVATQDAPDVLSITADAWS